MAGIITIQYQRHMRRNMLAACGLAGALCLVFILSLRIGAYPLGIGHLTELFSQNTGLPVQHVLWNIRLPRSLAAVLTGGCLGLAGVALQTVLRNSLASPFTLGISQGAAFGSAFAIIVLGTGSVIPPGNVPALLQGPGTVVCAAFAGSLVTVALLMALAAWRDLSPAHLVLAGVAISSFFGAATMLLQYFASDMQVAAAVFWTFGDLGRARWPEIAVMASVLIPAFAYFWRKRWPFNALLWGDHTAASLGIRVYRLRLTALIVAALIAALATSFFGVIGFIGLIAPHITRMFFGHDHRFLIPCSAMAGSLLLLVSDALARTVLDPIVLPVGILTSFAGTPLFIYLLVRKGDAAL